MALKPEGRIVYTTGIGRCCPDCGRAKDACRCSKKQSLQTPVKTDGIIRVSRETKGRRGKGVTVITGVPLTGTALADLAKALKQQCGSGGTLKDGVIEIQGDHRDGVMEALKAKGWTVKRCGG